MAEDPSPASEAHPSVSLDDFARCAAKDIKDLTAEEVACLIDFLTQEHQDHWHCVLGALGYVVNVKGGGTFPDTSYTLRLVDSLDAPGLAIHQYGGLNAQAKSSRGHLFLKPTKKNEPAFGAFGRFLTTVENMHAPKPKQQRSH